MRNDFESNYLAHHGILGMKWGRRQGPPYPLGPSDHSAAEKKAGYKKSLGGGRNESLYDRKINKLRRAAAASNRDADDLKKHGYHKESEAVRNVAKQQNEKADRVQRMKEENNGGMAPRQKKVLAVAGTVAGLSLAKTAIAGVGYNAFVKELSNDVFRAPIGSIAAGGLKRAGKMAVIGGLAAYGVMKLSDAKKQKKALKKIDRANRAKEEAATAKKLAGSYVNAMDRKAADREAKAQNTYDKKASKEVIKAVKNSSSNGSREKVYQAIKNDNRMAKVNEYLSKANQLNKTGDIYDMNDKTYSKYSENYDAAKAEVRKIANDVLGKDANKYKDKFVSMVMTESNIQSKKKK